MLATASGLYFAGSVDADWDHLDLPVIPVTATAASLEGGRLLAGTRPAGVFASEGG